ncbi:MAG TPA: hypothetical protein VF719_11005, partial [Abditibacteriaceae bacterium]
IPLIALARNGLGNSLPFERSLQIFNPTPLPNFSPSAANTSLQSTPSGFLATVAAPLVFFGELTQQLGPRGIPVYFSVVLLLSLLWLGLAFLGEWRKPPVAFICLIALQLFGAAYYWSSFRAPSRTIKTPFTSFDFHTHTTYSSGLLTPQQQIDWHRARGFKGLAFTDSDLMIPQREFAALVAKNPDMLLLNGSEYRGSTHLILLGLKSAITSKQYDVQGAIAAAKKQGAIVIVAHPWTGGSSISTERFIQLGVDGFEAWNGVVWRAELARTARSRKLLATTGTDTLSKSGSRSYTWSILPRGMDDSGDVLRALRMRKVAAAFALDTRDTPEAYDARQRTLKKPRGLFVATGAAWNSLTRTQQLCTLLGAVASGLLLWAWGAGTSKRAMHLAGPQRAVGFLRKRRIAGRMPSVALMVLAWAGSIAAAIYALSWTEKLTIPGLTPLHAVAAWLICDIIFLYGRSLWQRSV